MPRVAHLLSTMHGRLDALEVVAREEDGLSARSPSISAWSVAQHVEHLAAANELTLGAAAALVRGSDARIVPGGAPNWLGRMVLLLGWIPRGRGRAPEPTVPRPDQSAAGLRTGLARGRALLDELAGAPGLDARAAGRLPHPALGHFTAAQWVRFSAIHVHHHLRIVAEIRAGQRSR